MTKRVGIYSGTFDPVHPGHIAFAQATLAQCKLDTVVFLPEPQPRGKVGVSPLERRVQLLQQAVEQLEGLEVAVLSAPRFTVKDTLPEIEQRFAGAELTLLAGSDVVPGLPQWKGVDSLLSRVSLAVGMRAGDSTETVLQALAQLEASGHPCAYTLIHTEYAHLSSSQLRS